MFSSALFMSIPTDVSKSRKTESNNNTIRSEITELSSYTN